jgi:hypothetical protein
VDALKETLIFLTNYLRLNLSWNLDCGDDKMIYNGVYSIGKAAESVQQHGATIQVQAPNRCSLPFKCILFNYEL